MCVCQKRNDDVYIVKFITAKSRVAHLKQLTIPRLELQVAVLASRLAKSIPEESRIHFGNVYFFTDSTITLALIESPSRSFKPFVSSRVGEIQSYTDPSQWRHIPGEDNVADDLSQRITVNELSGRCMKGPEFLRLPQEERPNGTPPPTQDEDMECRQTKLAVSVVAVKAEHAVDPSTFSSWRRLIRVTVRIRRLAEKIRLRRNRQEGKEGPLSHEELQGAEIFWVKQAQKTLHSRMEKGAFKSPTPFKDGKGIIRVRGRLDKAIVSYEEKHPVLLPTEHRISLLITGHMHLLGHTGVATTTAKTRKYSILKGNKLSKSLSSSACTVKMAHKAEMQLMANLPSLHLAPQTPPFLLCCL